MKKKNSKLKKVFILIGILVLTFGSAISYLIITDLKQEDLLKKEIINVSNKNFLTDDYKIEVKTTGDYAYIEEAIKKYYQELSLNIKTINSYLNNKELLQILAIDNLNSDKPEFKESYQTLNDTRTKTKEALNNISKLCKEDTIKNLLDKKKVDDYSYELYLNLMYTKEDLKELEDTSKEMQELSNKLNTLLDKIENMLNILRDNPNRWHIDGGQLYFKSDSLVNEYNRLYNDLNDYVKDNFANNNNNDFSQNSNV